MYHELYIQEALRSNIKAEFKKTEATGTDITTATSIRLVPVWFDTKDSWRSLYSLLLAILKKDFSLQHFCSLS